MKLARLAKPNGDACWYVIAGGEAFNYRLVEPSFPGVRSDAELVAAVMARQPMRLETLMSMMDRGRTADVAERLAAFEPNQLADYRRLLPAETEPWLPPIEATSFRDFYAFEAHVKAARARRGLDMVPEWYDAPAFYFSNTASIVGHGAPIRKPALTNELDYELEIAVVIGRDGGDIPVEEADGYIAGFTILNDWSARDIQRAEMKVGLGPAKGKDFATSIGPYLVTPDELEEHVLPDRSRGKRYDLAMSASVNGREYSRGNARGMRWAFAELIAHASRDTILKAGDLIGSGTVGTGCITEFPTGTYPWLQPGDVVRLEIDGLGALENAVMG